ncbi:hypothetical protein DL770_005091 [Monosporascus sp. CRB-9-2]|nr:hypothetical protein DL770_005091 [Monosporascus sp. CRB-9-2]
MPSTTKIIFYKFVDFIPGFKFGKGAMAQDDKFRPTHSLGHRYESAEVLQKILIEEHGFKKDQFVIKSTNGKGLQVQLPEGKSLSESFEYRPIILSSDDNSF